jgi:PAS domain S-box-containing protein
MATILIAEDRDIDRQYLATLLGYYGHRVIQTSDGAQALKAAVLEGPDLIISDVLMPTLDGFEFVRQLRATPGVAQPPVIFHTAVYHQREARTLAQQCGVEDVLTKPSEPEAIMAKVDAVLGHPSVVMIPRSVAGLDREHLRIVSDTLVEKIAELEASQLCLAAVVTLCHRFASQLDPITLLKSVCAAARDVTLARYSVVGLTNDDGAGVLHAVTCGLDVTAGCATGVSLPRGPLLDPILNDRAAVRQTNPDGRPERFGLPSTHPGVYSYLGVPIASPAKVYGWIELQNKIGADEFNDRDEQVAVMIGIQAGIAYENARLVDDLRRQATALQISDERTNYALGGARMGLWDFDMVTQRLTWSETLAPIFGLAPKQAPSSAKAFLNLIHPDDRRMVEDSLARAAQEGTDYEVEFRGMWPDGTPRWIAGRARMHRDAEGRPVRLLGVASDISDRKALEGQFRQAQKMEAVGQLAGGIAHDFNNLLTAILGYSNFVIGTFEPQDRRRLDMEEVVTAGQRAAALTRQLLIFSRKQVLRPTTLDLNALVTGMRQMLSRLIGEHVDLVCVLAPDVGAIRADQGQLEQVLMNLVINARDAMPSGGRLAVETANVELDHSSILQHVAVRPGSYVMLAVSDSGIGMTEETKQRLFEPFFTTKEPGKGTGLGLATVDGIVKQSGGGIWVYSEPGKGATFKVYLPRAVGEGAVQKSTVQKSTVSDKAVAAGTETVLVVEDEGTVRLLTRRILERAGYRVFDAPNPQQAEALFEQHMSVVTLLVTDVVMPGSSGPKLFERLARQRPDLKVLYVSGYTDDTIAHQGQLDPGVEFLQKPFTADALNRRVREVLDR